jgi:hypothetical protein
MYRKWMVAAAVIAGALGAGAQGMEEARAQVKAAWETHKSLRCKVLIDAGPLVGETRVGMYGEGTAQALRAEDGERYKSTVKMSFPPPASDTRMQVETVFDGKNLHISNEALGRRLTRDAKPGLFRGAIPPGGPLLLEALEAELDIERLPDVMLNNVSHFAFEGRARKGDGAVGPVVKARVLIAKSTGALVKLELFESNEVMTVRVEQSDFAWDVELDPAIFEPAKGDPETVTPQADESTPGVSKAP